MNATACPSDQPRQAARPVVAHRPGWYRPAREMNATLDPAPPDGELVAALALGDQAALGTLYDRHAPALVGLARRLLGSVAEAEDVVHDVFLEAWRHAADYDPTRASVRAWLVLRTRSRALDRLKAPSRQRTVSTGDASWLEGLVGPAPEGGPTPDAGALRLWLAALPPEQQRVLVLGYFEGLTSAEMAEALGVPIGTVKSRVAAALSKLRSIAGEAA